MDWRCNSCANECWECPMAETEPQLEPIGRSGVLSSTTEFSHLGASETHFCITVPVRQSLTAGCPWGNRGQGTPTLGSMDKVWVSREGGSCKPWQLTLKAAGGRMKWSTEGIWVGSHLSPPSALPPILQDLALCHLLLRPLYLFLMF